MPIDPLSGVPAWRQVADDLRSRIARGEWPPGSLLPPAPRLRDDYAVGKATIKAATDELRAKGLVDLERGIGIRVREHGRKDRVKVPRGATTEGRMPTDEERRALGLPEGVGVFVVTFGSSRKIYGQNRTLLTHS